MNEPAPSLDDRPARRGLLHRVPVGTLLLIGALVGLWAWLGRTAPTPPLFERGMTLAAAVEEARRTDRLVFAVATADWCAPCQSYKRNALVDPRVEAWIRDHAESVYIDVDAAPADAQTLGVRGVPSTFLLRDGQIIASASGAISANDLLELLESAPK